MKNDSKVFRSNWWAFLLRFSTFFVLLVVDTIIYGMFLGTKYLAEIEASFFSLLPWIAGGVLVLGGIVTLKNFVMSLLRYFGTFLKISSEQIEYQNWPYYGIICRWDEIKSLEKRKKYGFTFDVLVPDTFEHLGKGTFLGIKFRKKMGIKEETYIPLNLFSGWPNGKLAREIQKNTQHLFEEKESHA